MPNIRLTIAYDGTDYAGWQVQKNAKTVQAEIEKALKKIFREKIKLIGAGRTDSGVHAKAQVANFSVRHCEAERSEAEAIPYEIASLPLVARNDGKKPLLRLQAALNSNLPPDIRITAAKKVPSKFHSQYDAKSKLYRYTILNGRIDDPFTKNYYHKVPYGLDVSLMKKEAKVLLGKHDFKSFQAKSNASKIKSTVRTIRRIGIKQESSVITINFEGDGFLHNMVRNLMGTLIEIGRGYFPKGSMRKILDRKDRTKAGPTAPACGLTLIKVKY